MRQVFTFKVLRRQKYGTDMVLFYQLLDLRRDRIPLKSHLPKASVSLIKQHSS